MAAQQEKPKQMFVLSRHDLAGDDAQADGDDVQEYERDRVALVLRYVPRLLVFLVVFTIIVWPLDRYGFAGLPAAVELMDRERRVCIGIGLAAILLLCLGAVRRSPMPWVIGVMVVVAFEFARIIGALGALGLRLTPYAMVLVLFPVPLPLRVGERVFTTSLIVLVAVAGFFLSGGREGGAIAVVDLSYLCFVGVGSVVFGHFQQNLLLTNFTQARQLERGARRLARLNASLQDQVFEQTASLRVLTERLTNAVEQERARLASDLHDDLGQHLTAVRMAARLARNRAGTPAEGALAALESLVSRSHDVLREIVWQLRPQLLDQLGLAEAVEALARRMNEHGGLVVTCEVEDDGSAVAEPTALACFRIAQEALTNAARHAEASHAQIAVRVAGSAVELVVTDDGRGLAARGPGTGITSMSERALSVGGALELGPSAPTGTRVSFVAPAQGGLP